MLRTSFIVFSVILLSTSTRASSMKEELALKLFSEAAIEDTLRKAAEQHFPNLPEDLQLLFPQNQDKFDSIFETQRAKYLEKWLKKITENYQNMWVMAYTENFSEKELSEMLDIYQSDLFKRFQEQFNKIDLAHIEQLTSDTFDVALSYGQLIRESLIEAKKAKLDAKIIDAELEKLDLIQGNIRDFSPNKMKQRNNF